jgi:hypothetical protein
MVGPSAKRWRWRSHRYRGRFAGPDLSRRYMNHTTAITPTAPRERQHVHRLRQVMAPGAGIGTAVPGMRERAHGCRQEGEQHHAAHVI